MGFDPGRPFPLALRSPPKTSECSHHPNTDTQPRSPTLSSRPVFSKHSPKTQRVVVAQVGVVLIVVAVLVQLLRDETEHGDVDARVEHEEEEDELLAAGVEHLPELARGHDLLCEGRQRLVVASLQTWAALPNSPVFFFSRPRQGMAIGCLWGEGGRGLRGVGRGSKRCYKE